MKIEIRPIEKQKWHGKTGNENFTRSKKLQALVKSSTMEYDTGLDNANKTFEDPDSNKKITEQEYYSKLLKQDLSKQYNPDAPHSFWDSNLGSIELQNNTQFLDTDNPIEYIKIKVLKQSKFVANSMKDYNEGFFPEATHVIFDEKEEIQVRASKVALKNKAVIEASKLSKSRKIEIVLILAGKNLKGKSDDFVEVEISDLINKQPEEVLRQINANKEDVNLQALVIECMQKSILTKKGHKIYYMDNYLGQDIEEVSKYLKEPENQEFKLRLISQVS